MNESNKAADAGSSATTPRGCERAGELVTYLYGEATPAEAGVFRQHLGGCAVCREEIAALGGVREAVGVWRAEALGSIPSLDIGEALSTAFVTRQAPERKRSASAALREFFSLAPLWLRAGAFAATLAVCALAALTLARAEVSWDANGLAFRTGAPERVAGGQAPAQHEASQPKKLYTEEQVEAIVARNVSEATAHLTEQQRQKQPTAGAIVNVSGGGDKPRTQSAPASVQRRKRSARNDARRDESLLADDNLPRLSDLLDGSY